jgi:hypothetical protein
MPRQNPYMMDPLLAQGFSNLTKALIGDPETDYQVARTGYQNEQTNRLKTLLPFETKSLAAQEAQRRAAAYASTKQGGLYNQQTTDLQTDAANLLALSQSPELVGVAASMFDLGEGANLSPEVGQSLLYRLFQEGDANSIASALATMGEGQDFNTARGVVLDKNADINEKIIANAMLGNAPNEYSKPDFPQTKLDATLQNNLDVKELDNAGNIAVANVNKQSAKDVQTIDSEAQKIWEAYSADRKKEADVTVQELKNTQSGVEAANRLAAEIQWESENNVIVEDGRMVFSPEAAKKYGVTNTVNLGSAENPQEMYIIDVSPENKNGISVTIEGTDQEIFLDQQYFDKFNVQNRNGKFVIPQGSVTGTSKGTSPTSRTTNATQYLTEEMYADLTTFLKERIPASLGDLPNNVQLGTETFIIKQVDAFIGRNPNTPYMDAYNRVGAPIASGGVVELGNNDLRRSNIKVPRFFDEKWKSAAAKVGKPVTNGGDPYTRDQLVEAITKNATSLGYTPSDISKILESY